MTTKTKEPTMTPLRELPKNRNDLEAQYTYRLYRVADLLLSLTGKIEDMAKDKATWPGEGSLGHADAVLTELDEFFTVPLDEIPDDRHSDDICHCCDVDCNRPVNHQ